MKTKALILIFIIVITASCYASQSSFQRTETMFYDEEINYIKLVNIDGRIEFQNNEEEITYQGLIFLDAGKLEESRRLSAITNIKSYISNDTLFIICIYPSEQLKELKFERMGSYFSDVVESEYNGIPITISRRSGIEAFIDFKISVPSHVKIILEMNAAEINFDNINYSIGIESDFSLLKGTITDGELTCVTKTSNVYLEGISGKCKIKSSEKLDFESSKDMTGSLTLICNHGDINIKNNGTLAMLNIHQKTGKQTYVGTCPDSLLIENKDVASRIELKDNSGYCKILSEIGENDIYFSESLFGIIDIASKTGEIKINTKLPITLENNSKTAYYESENTGKIFIRSNRSDIDIKIYD